MSGLIGQQLGNYEILSLLGKGGMATVYRARQLNIKREVAIKVIKPDLAESADFTKRFEREAETIAALDHPHIIKLFDYGQHGDMVYLVMQLLKGGSLADVIRGGTLPLDTVSLILDQICAALDYAHERGLIHRDLKPQNVLLDEKGNALLTDFGIARLISQSTALTQSGVAMGTPAYMSPEQWQSREFDSRADIYALGVMLFEMLTGRVPFDADTPGRMVYLHLYESPPPVSVLRPDLSPAIESVVNKALAKSADERFQTAGELAEAFRAALSGQAVTLPPRVSGISRPASRPVLAGSTPSTGQTTQPASRRSASTLLGIGVIALILILLGGSLAAVLGNRTVPTPTLTPSSTEIMMPTVPIPTTTLVPPATQVAAAISPSATETSNPETRAALTFAAISTGTAKALSAVHDQETVDAVLAKTLTAIAPKSATPTPTLSPTPVPTERPTAEIVVSPTFSQTPSLIPATNTSTLTVTASATPTFTSSPTSTATNTLTPSVTVTSLTLTPIPCTVSTDKANTVPIRVGPGKNRGLRDYMAANYPYQVIGQAQASDGSAWWQLQIDDNSEAWVAQVDVSASGDCGQIEIVPTPQVQIAKPKATNTPTPKPSGGSGGGGNSGGGGSGGDSSGTTPPTSAPTCGGDGQPCCGGSVCDSGLTCSGGICQQQLCGKPGLPCCAGDSCIAGICNTSTHMCG